MDVVLNVTPALRHTTGIGTYAKELALALLDVDRKNRYTLFFSRNPFSGRRSIYGNIRKNKNVRFKAINLPYRVLNFLWNGLGLFPVENICGRCDIFHSLDMLSPFVKNAKLLTTVHDLSWLVFGDNSKQFKTTLYNEVSKSLNRSKTIVADSIFTKKELLKYFSSLKEDKIEVIHLGVSNVFHPMDSSSIQYGKNKYNWGDFILYVGALGQSRKNLIRLVNAYSKLKKKGHIREKLVLCGSISKRARGLLKTIERLDLRRDIIVYERWIPDEEMPLLYNMAKILIYPSLYEGFGLPILEAMACGTPVITSNTSSMPEVGGDACLYIDPYDTESIGKAVERLLCDNALRQRLSLLGLERIKKYGWHNAAQATIELYEKALGG